MTLQLRCAGTRGKLAALQLWHYPCCCSRRKLSTLSKALWGLTHSTSATGKHTQEGHWAKKTYSVSKNHRGVQKAPERSDIWLEKQAFFPIFPWVLGCAPGKARNWASHSKPSLQKQWLQHIQHLQENIQDHLLNKLPISLSTGVKFLPWGQGAFPRIIVYSWNYLWDATGMDLTFFFKCLYAEGKVKPLENEVPF